MVCASEHLPGADPARLAQSGKGTAHQHAVSCCATLTHACFTPQRQLHERYFHLKDTSETLHYQVFLCMDACLQRVARVFEGAWMHGSSRPSCDRLDARRHTHTHLRAHTDTSRKARGTGGRGSQPATATRRNVLRVQTNRISYWPSPQNRRQVGLTQVRHRPSRSVHQLGWLLYFHVRGGIDSRKDVHSAVASWHTRW